MRRWICWLASTVLAATPAMGAEALSPGLSRSRPDNGRFVETERGFMVPYTVQIPGTDVSFHMEPIPGGTFLMGSPDSETGRSEDEGPQVLVHVEPCWMGRYEVTWSEYKVFMGLYSVFKEFESKQIRQVTADNRVDAVTAPTELYDPTFTFEFGEEPRQPAVTMTQYAAKQYTKWLSAITETQYRLPSEAEWEYACRAGSTTAYAFGDDGSQLAEYGWYYGNSDFMPQLVGQKKPNAWGLYDMHGNVWEWVLDAYHQDGYERFEGRQVSAVEAISWPNELFPRVVRGGSWEEDADLCRSAAKMPSHDYDWKDQDPNLPLSPWWFTSDPARGVGFRLLRPLVPLPKSEMGKFWEIDVEETEFDVTSRLDEGRGVLGLVDPELPAAIQALESR